MNPMDVVNEKKLSIIQKYWHLLLVIALAAVIYFQSRKIEELNVRILQRADEQLKGEQQKNRDLMEINRLSRELEQQARILNTQTEKKDYRIKNQ